MTVALSEPVPLSTDTDGVIRVGGTRVTLETVVGSFLDGASAEEIKLRYPAVQLADIYATIAYYLRHRSEVDDYLSKAEETCSDLRQRAQAVDGAHDLRSRLLASRET